MIPTMTVSATSLKPMEHLAEDLSLLGEMDWLLTGYQHPVGVTEEASGEVAGTLLNNLQLQVTDRVCLQDKAVDLALVTVVDSGQVEVQERHPAEDFIQIRIITGYVIIMKVI